MNNNYFHDSNNNNNHDAGRHPDVNWDHQHLCHLEDPVVLKIPQGKKPLLVTFLFFLFFLKQWKITS